MIEDLEKIAGLRIPKDLASNEANEYLADACKVFKINCPPPQTTARLLDKVLNLLHLYLENTHFPSLMEWRVGVSDKPSPDYI